MPKITQKQLTRLVSAKNKVEKLQAEVKEAEAALLVSLKAGAEVQPGLLTTRIKTWTRRNVAWKEILIREKSQEYADRVLAATKPEEFEKLEIEIA